MQFIAVNVSSISPVALQYGPQPVCQWPTDIIEVDGERSDVCIASWRRDVGSSDEVSARLSECVWDAIHLGFRFMLCDLISVPQDSPDLSERIIAFSDFYSKLHVVTSYDVDPDLMRPWLRHEAYKLLTSQTSLAYLLHKWELRVPLINSLIINQVCVRRLGIANFRKDLLPLCDTEEVFRMSIGDLHLLDADTGRGLGATICLDRRNQQFASDALLVHELRVTPKRSQLIQKLCGLRTNSNVVPSLCVIWAVIEGISISVRGCDWDVRKVAQSCVQIIQAAFLGQNDTVTLEKVTGGLKITLQGTIRTNAVLEISSLEHIDSPENLVVRCLDRPAAITEPATVETFLNRCIDFATKGLRNGLFPEPSALSSDASNYTVGFDEHAGPCATREWPYSGIRPKSDTGSGQLR